MTDLSQTQDASERHSVPVIDRMMEILGQLERRAEGASITDLTQQVGQPRTTVYRILKTLERHDMVRRDGARTYRLGARLLQLAAHVAARAADVDLPRLAQPILDRLAEETGEGVKLSIVEGQSVLVIAVAQSRREYALTVARGQRIPLHVGAAGKLMLANLPPREREALLARPLPALTPRTVTDPAQLRLELDRIREAGWARDHGEQVVSVNAVAAPVADAAGRVVAAISVPFVAGTPDGRIDAIRAAAIGAAGALGDRLRG